MHDGTSSWPFILSGQSERGSQEEDQLLAGHPTIMAAGILLCPVCRPCCFYLSVSPCLWICPSGLNIHLVPEGDVLYWFWGNALQDIFSSIGGSLLFHTLICLNWTGWDRAPFNEYFVLLFVSVFYRFWQSKPIWHFWVSPSCCIPHMPDAWCLPMHHEEEAKRISWGWSF